ncbi:MAG: TIGR01777 family oxidoreductase [Planctomycetota bacterium]
MGRERVLDVSVGLGVERGKAFDWHVRPGALERLMPPWDKSRVVRFEGLRDGQEAELRVWAPWPRRWVARHEGYVGGERFCDVQVAGPMKAWRHEHLFEGGGGDRAAASQPRACDLRDLVRYRMPMGVLGDVAHSLFARRDIERMFEHRHRVLRQDVEDHEKYGWGAGRVVAVTGTGGLLGRALVPYLTTGGYVVRPVLRKGTEGREVLVGPREIEGVEGGVGEPVVWDTGRNVLEGEGLCGVDAVVHLAGEPILDGVGKKWDAGKKRRIMESRVESTRMLAEAMSGLHKAERPRAFVCASAMGFYGADRGEVLTEGSSKGEGFLSDVCAAWEGAADAARDAGVRTVHLRYGMVLSPKDAGLAAMLPAFRLGIGGRLADGKHYWSWVGIEDAVGMVGHALGDERVSGAVNAVAGAVTNREFTRVLGKVLKRPTVLPAPGAAIKAVFGKELAESMLLGSFEVEPGVLRETGYRFRHAGLEGCLRDLLGK